MIRRVTLLAFVAILAVSGESWKVRYVCEKDERCAFVDFAFPSAKRGIAVGYTSGHATKAKPFGVVTADEGKTWSEIELPEIPISLYFLDDTRGWLVTPGNIWKTEESGRTWKKIKSVDGALRVHFVDEKHGFAVGLRKLLVETFDGGETWRKVAAAAEPSTKPEYTAYTWIVFRGKRAGMVVGQSTPPRREELADRPGWLDPETAAKRRQWPNVLINLETTDGGANWKAATVPAFGAPTRVRMNPSGQLGMILFRFNRSFEYPSEVFWLDTKSEKSARAFRAEDRMVTDCAFLGGDSAILAAIEPAAKLHTLPIPGKVRILRFDGKGEWKEMKVDYRASAREAMLSVPDERNAWVALDTGMILKLEP